MENVVKYVKHNFLYGRVYSDIQTLQLQALGWLERTGNAMPHSTTRKVPAAEWVQEQPHLKSWAPVYLLPQNIFRHLRKDNTFSFNGNFYTVPQGTYKGKDSLVNIWLKEEHLHVHDRDDVFLCKHAIAEGSGNTVINTDHKRDKSLKVKELIIQTANQFSYPALALHYFELLRKEKGRYLRDLTALVNRSYPPDFVTMPWKTATGLILEPWNR